MTIETARKLAIHPATTQAVDTALEAIINPQTLADATLLLAASIGLSALAIHAIDRAIDRAKRRRWQKHLRNHYPQKQGEPPCQSTTRREP